ncbi:WD domain, G-beta repeat domain containing protein [Plasmodium gonderi]|uniref:WD domain, G-beta repeat domain containing protein n=1 Tax=Plasmodium gonderi TaxID=77519 RepID=A0A1Y1JMN0_PLAGO|nr:WD domain, G-beta repeat domain containing protein [Plasmodium gonderi]GAW81294.1 WD domain, G-beta repeat domain containing protein [Plasmodium gonderi]
MNSVYTSINCESVVFDVEFHPKLDLICAGLFDGNLLLYKLKEEKKKFQKKWNIYNHKKTVSCVSFSNNGKKILVASSDNKCSLTDITGKLTWTNLCHNNSICSILFTSLNTFLTADETGIIKHWDMRDESKKPIHKIKEFDDTISSMFLNADEKSVVVSCGGHLALFDILNKKKISSHSISTEHNDEFLCSKLLAHNSKIVCTTMNGYIAIFSKQPWANMEGKIKASKDMISTFVKLDEYTILFGTSDGIIKLAHILPNKIGDVIATEEGGESVEKLTINKKKNLFASISHNTSIHFYPIHVNNSEISGKIKKKKKSFFHDL